MSEEQSLRLSICIPTYNRAALLAEALESVTTQWAHDLTPLQQEAVEIIVSDNCSPDETSCVVEKTQAAYPHLRLTYFRQTENVGPDANIWNAARLAQGEYIYILSDDDILLLAALAAMLALLEEYPDLDAYCLNSKPFAEDPSEDRAPVFAVENDEVLAGRDACLSFVGTRITFLSLLLFRRERFRPDIYRPLIGSCMMHAYIFIDVLAGETGMVVTKRVFLGTRENNTGGYNFFEVFVTEFGALMRHARQQGYSPAAVRMVLRRHLKSFLVPFTLMFKVRGAYGRLQPDFGDGAKRMLAEYGPQPVIIFGLLPLMFVPQSLARTAYAVARVLKRRPAGSRVQ